MITEQWRDVERIYHEALLLRPAGEGAPCLWRRRAPAIWHCEAGGELVLRQAASGEGVLNTHARPPRVGDVRQA